MSARLWSAGLRYVLIAFATLTWCLPAQAHKASDSYLTVKANGQQLDLQWDIALRDLDMAIGLDENGDGDLTWAEVRARHDAIAAYALARLKIRSQGAPCELKVREHLLDEHSDGAYAVLRIGAACAAEPQALEIDYQLLFDIDPQHKGLLRLERGAVTSTAIFTPEQSRQLLQLGGGSRWRQFADYVKHGVWHIWIGFDHILFLLSLLLPSVLVYRERAWLARDTFRASAIEVLKIVTAFTLAHSITLTLATLGVISLPSRLVESAIAASVALAALNNVWPVLQRRLAFAAFGFGLIHGFGFASVLRDLGLPQDALLLSLVGFNVGVELGQLTIVAVFLPLAFWARRSAAYRTLVLRAGSVVIALLALLWLFERVFDVKLIS